MANTTIRETLTEARIAIATQGEQIKSLTDKVDHIAESLDEIKENMVEQRTDSKWYRNIIFKLLLAGTAGSGISLAAAKAIGAALGQ